ncbi:MAG: thioredoxin family protein [SAR202 cluster bacterium]|nr:thioredoxin family protein [SAR202 cluster bacterium]
MNKLLKLPFFPALAALGLALAVACGSSAAATPEPRPTSTPADPTAITPILATTILEVGEQRLAFLLTTTKGLIKSPTATVTTVYLDGDGTPGETLEAGYNAWPYGIRGSYSAYANFDRAGRWRLDVHVDNPAGVDEIQIEVEILEKSPVPAIGSVAPKSITKTLGKNGSIETITTDYTPDPDLYQLSIKEAVENSMASVVVFASPAFCTSPTCGPQVDAVTELKDKYLGKANFIHVEIYDNPAEIQGDLDKAEIFSVVDDWGLTAIEDYFNESWTFVLDVNGKIIDRFEGFATVAELEAALLQVLPQA